MAGSLIIVILLFSFFVVLAAIFAGSETGLYQLSRIRLQIGVRERKMKYLLLEKVVKDSSGTLMSLLIGTNLAHYLATAVITTFMLSSFKDEHTAELFSTALIAPLLFVFSELIPKNVFFCRADTIMPYISYILYPFHKLLCIVGIVPVLRLISTLFSKFMGRSSQSGSAMSSFQGHQIRALLRDTREEGILTPLQAEIIGRIAEISTVKVFAAMTKFNDVVTIDINSGRDTVLACLERHNFTRILVSEGRNLRIIGYINIYQVLSSDHTAYGEINHDFENLRPFLKPIETLDVNTPVTEAMEIMNSTAQKLMLITRTTAMGRKTPVGIVTMKDLAEELLGDLAEW